MSARRGEAMRRRLQKFFPIFLIALTVQLFGPIASCWTAAIAASDPFAAAEICHGMPAQSPASGDQGGDPRAHDGLCSICCAARANASLHVPNSSIVVILYRDSDRVLWPDGALEHLAAGAAPNAQARAPPQRA